MMGLWANETNCLIMTLILLLICKGYSFLQLPTFLSTPIQTWSLTAKSTDLKFGVAWPTKPETLRTT